MNLIEQLQIENFKYIDGKKMIFKEDEDSASLWGEDDNGVSYELVTINKQKEEN